MIVTVDYIDGLGMRTTHGNRFTILGQSILASPYNSNISFATPLWSLGVCLHRSSFQSAGSALHTLARSSGMVVKGYGVMACRGPFHGKSLPAARPQLAARRGLHRVSLRGPVPCDAVGASSANCWNGFCLLIMPATSCNLPDSQRVYAGPPCLILAVHMFFGPPVYS